MLSRYASRATHSLPHHKKSRETGLQEFRRNSFHAWLYDDFRALPQDYKICSSRLRHLQQTKIPSGTSLSCQSFGLNGVNITFTYYSVQVQRVQQPPVNTCNRERP